MKLKTITVPMLAATLAITPMTADAHGWHGGGHGGGGLLFGIGAAVGALAVGTAMIVTAPINAIASAPYYSAPPAYYSQGPSPAYYQQQPSPAYYQQQQQSYYQQPQPYYQPQPSYYYPPQGGYYYR